MWHSSVLEFLRFGSARTRAGRSRRLGPSKRPATCKLHLEPLEDRCLLSTISLVPSEAAPQLVGEQITWTATVSDGPTAGLVYQFRDGPADGPFHVARDFSPDNHFTWAPMEEGRFKIMVTVKQGFAATDSESAVVRDLVNSRVTGADAVITPMSNPLVALYSAPPVSEETMHVFPHELEHVEFSVASDNPSWRSTNELRIEKGKSTNFLVAGMMPNTTYEMRHVLEDGTASSPLLFTTGSIPSSVTLPAFTVRQPPGPNSDPDQDMIFHDFFSVDPNNNAPKAVATDLTGRVVWYFDALQSGRGLTDILPPDLVPGGTVLLLARDRYSPAAQNVLREIDLAGDPLRETNLDAVNAQLTALGHDVIYGFHHDVQRLPNGATAVLGFTERTVSIRGTPTAYIGDMIVVLDRDFQVAWAWDAFDHLDVNRAPTLHDTCVPGGPGCPPGLDHVAVDWTHSNAVAWSPADGNLTLSVRHQDWVIKIDYQGGRGDGHILWRLGKDSDFTTASTDPYPWSSHQHDAHFVDASTLVLFDNGNTRRAGDPNAHNRGQAWTLDEETMTATPVLNADLGVYSPAFGAAQRLSNGNFSFTSGFQGRLPKLFGQTFEVLPDGTTTYVLQAASGEYRSYRVRTLYQGTNVPLNNAGGESREATTPGTRHGPALAVAGHFQVVERVEPPGNGSGTSSVPADAFLDQLSSSVAAALATSVKPPVSWTTPSPSAPIGVGMVLPLEGMWEDELLAAATGRHGGLAKSLAKHNPPSRADDLWAVMVGTDGAMDDWPFLAVPQD